MISLASLCASGADRSTVLQVGSEKRELWPRKLIQLTAHDPNFWLWYPAWAGYVTITYPLGLYDPIKKGDIYDPINPEACPRQVSV